MVQTKEAITSEASYKMRRSYRVVVTGMGAVSPLGLNWKDTWEGMVAGKSGIQRISTSDWELKDEAYNSQVDIAGLVMNFDASSYIPKKELNRIHRSAQFSTIASREALIQAGLFDPQSKMEKGKSNLLGVDPERLGAIISTGIGGGSEIAKVEDILQGLVKGTHISPFAIPSILPERVATVPSIWLGAKAEVAMIGAACAGGSEAITAACRILAGGEADVMLAGGSEAAVHRVALAGFNNMTALNKEPNDNPESASRPFDQGAAGFVMGEGAGILVLETLEHALGRGANILAELVGYGNTADGYHDTTPNQIGAEKAIRKALAMAEIEPSEVDYINAHGTSTPLNDPMELKALRAVYGDKLPDIAISSTKSMTGHFLSSTGALEAAVCIQAIQDGVVPPTINLENPIKEGEGLNLVPQQAQKREVKVAVTESFGLGGPNSVLIFRRYPSDLEKIAA